MCSICGGIQHATWCPERSDPSVFTCESCGEGICDGEQYYEINGKYYHNECLHDNYCISEILKMFGAKVEIARLQ